MAERTGCEDCIYRELCSNPYYCEYAEFEEWDSVLAKAKQSTDDGEFTADELEAIAWWMKNKGE